jgi:hypothetical protein
MRRKGSRRLKRRGRNNSSMILTSFPVIKKGFVCTPTNLQLIVIPAAPACQAHGSGTGLPGSCMLYQAVEKLLFLSS